MKLETAIRRLQALAANGWTIDASYRTETTWLPLDVEQLAKGLPGDPVFRFSARRPLPGGSLTFEMEGANPAVIAGELVDLCAAVVVTE